MTLGQSIRWTKLNPRLPRSSQTLPSHSKLQGVQLRSLLLSFRSEVCNTGISRDVASTFCTCVIGIAWLPFHTAPLYEMWYVFTHDNIGVLTSYLLIPNEGVPVHDDILSSLAVEAARLSHAAMLPEATRISLAEIAQLCCIRCQTSSKLQTRVRVAYTRVMLRVGQVYYRACSLWGLSMST